FVAQRLGGEGIPAPTGGHDSRTVDAGVFEARDGVGHAVLRRRGDEFAGHDFHPPRHTGHAHGVVADRANNSRDMRAVAPIIHGIAAAIQHVHAVHIVDVAVAIVIEPVGAL